MGRQQDQIDSLYNMVNFANLSPVAENAETAKLRHLVDIDNGLVHILWVSAPVGLIAPAIGFAWLFVRSRLSN